MKDLERGEFDKTLFALAEVLRADLSPGQLAGYWELLKDLSFESFAHAVRIAGQTLKFFPAPAELREFRPKRYASFESDYRDRCQDCRNFGWEHAGKLYKGILPKSVRETRFAKTHCTVHTIARDNCPEDNGRADVPQVYLPVSHAQKGCDSFLR